MTNKVFTYNYNLNNSKSYNEINDDEYDCPPTPIIDFNDNDEPNNNSIDPSSNSSENNSYYKILKYDISDAFYYNKTFLIEEFNTFLIEDNDEQQKETLEKPKLVIVSKSNLKLSCILSTKKSSKKKNKKLYKK